MAPDRLSHTEVVHTMQVVAMLFAPALPRLLAPHVLMLYMMLKHHTTLYLLA
jgi:hypothetical protein